jgi:hypothetical protein
VRTGVSGQAWQEFSSLVGDAWFAGRTNIMGRTSEQVAVHKDRYLVPVQLNVSKLSGVGEDTLFIGIMEVSKALHCARAACCCGYMLNLTHQSPMSTQTPKRCRSPMRPV